MKAKLTTTFDSYYGTTVTGHIKDAEMYAKVKDGTSWWKDTIYPRISHIRIPKEVFERLLELDRNQSEVDKLIAEAKSEVAKQIVEEIEKLISSECLVLKDERGVEGYVKPSVHYALAELKKKYTEGE